MCLAGQELGCHHLPGELLRKDRSWFACQCRLDGLGQVQQVGRRAPQPRGRVFGIDLPRLGPPSDVRCGGIGWTWLRIGGGRHARRSQNQLFGEAGECPPGDIFKKLPQDLC